MPAYSLEIILASAGLLLLLVEAFAETMPRKTLGYLGLAACTIGLVLLGIVEKPAAGYWGFYTADSQAMFYKGLSLICTAVVIVIGLEYAPVLESYRDGRPGRRGLGEFLSLPLIVCAGMMWMASMTDLLGIFVSLELVTISFYVLVAFMNRNVGSLEAGVKYLILGALSTGFLVYGIAWLFGITGQTGLAALGEALQSHADQRPAILFGVALLMVGMGFKVGAVPFQMWVPDVYQGAPTPVTAFLSVGSKAAGFAVLVRLLEPLIASPARSETLALLIGMAGATLLVGNLAAIGQSNFKRLLAYSSVSHAGFILLALAGWQDQGPLLSKNVAAFYLGTYLAMTLLCFLVLAIVRRHGQSEDLKAFDGLGKRSPFLAFALLIAAASLAGVPLTAGFFGKFFAFTLAVKSQLWALLALAVIGAAAGFYYYFKVVRSMYWNAPAADATALPAPSLLTKLTLLLLLAAIFFFGVMPQPLLGLLK